MSIIPSAAPNDTTPAVPDEDSHEAAVARYLSTPYTDDFTPAPMTPEREAEIRAELAAVPAPPWRWIGSRYAGGPELVTDHSGRQYLLRAAKPTDDRGDELLDPETDAVVYGDLEFRDQREGEKYSTMRSGNSLAAGRTEYDPDAIVGVANPVARWIETSAQHATALLAEVDRLRAELDKVTAFCAQRAEYVTSILNCHPDNKHDYYRWQGHAESRRQLSERLGLPVGWPAEDAVEADPTKATRMQDAQDTIADLRKAGA